MTWSLLSFEEAQSPVDCLEVDRVAEDLDAAGTKLGERRVDVSDVQAEVVVLLDAEAVVERIDRGVGLGRGAAEDLDLGGAVAEVGELHVAERPLLIDGEVELVLVPGDGAGVVDGADRNVVVVELHGHGVLLSTVVCSRPFDRIGRHRKRGGLHLGRRLHGTRRPTPGPHEERYFFDGPEGGAARVPEIPARPAATRRRRPPVGRSAAGTGAPTRGTRNAGGRQRRLLRPTGTGTRSNAVGARARCAGPG